MDDVAIGLYRLQLTSIKLLLLLYLIPGRESMYFCLLNLFMYKKFEDTSGVIRSRTSLDQT